MIRIAPFRIAVAVALAGCLAGDPGLRSSDTTPPTAPPTSARASESPSPPPRTVADLQALVTAGRYAEAERGARRLSRDLEAKEGDDAPATAEVLDVLVEALIRGGKFGDPEALKVAERALKIKKSAFGEEAAESAQSLSNLGVLFLRRGDSARAQAILDRVLSIREKSLGSEHVDVGKTLNNLALLASGRGDFSRARALHERSIAILEKNLGPEHPFVLTARNNLADVYQSLGEYARARETYEQVLARREEILGPEHPDLSQTLNNLALLLAVMGDFAGARRCYERALRIKEKALGPENGALASSLGNLAELLREMGNYTDARPLLERALAIAEKTLGPEHPDTAAEVDGLAGVLSLLGEKEGAIRLYERAVAIREKDNPEGVDLATSLNNLALVLAEDKQGARAGRLYDRALGILEKVLGSEHPLVAYSLNDRGMLYRQEGDYSSAGPMFRRALAIREKNLGPDHPLVAAVLNNLATIHWTTGQPSEALETALRAKSIVRRQFQETARSLGEREALDFERLQTSGLDLALSVLASAGQDSLPEGVLERVWDEQIHSRAFVLDEMADRHRTVITSEDPGVRQLVSSLETSRNVLARLVLRGSSGEGGAPYRELLEEAVAAKEQAERELAESSLAFREELTDGRAGLAEIRTALPEGSALLAFTAYARYPGSGSPPGAAPIPSYLAFVLKAGGAAQVFDLGPASEIEKRIQNWREQIALVPEGLPVAGSHAEIRYREAAERLRELIWDPVAERIEGARTVFVVPDGALNLVNLTTLTAKDGRYLIESGPLLHYLSAERDLVRHRRPRTHGEGIVLVGNPDYSDPAQTPSPARAGGSPLPATAGSPPLRGASGADGGLLTSCHDLQTLRFDPLPGSAAETREIESLWRKKFNRKGNEPKTLVRLDGAVAGEAAFKRMAPGHRILHLATHGYFVEDHCVSSLASAQASAREPLRGAGGSAMPILGENPLLLAGLALAGANLRASPGSSPDGEDGILTAEEVASLDLSGVEWVVLSACETGIGKVQSGEGVLGLRRAFETAGAGTLILSLWRVEDQASREWMRRLYQGRLRGLSTAEAVRNASLGMIRNRRARGRSIHPFFWGGFIAAGDWR